MFKANQSINKSSICSTCCVCECRSVTVNRAAVIHFNTRSKDCFPHILVAHTVNCCVPPSQVKTGGSVHVVRLPVSKITPNLIDC